MTQWMIIKFVRGCTPFRKLASKKWKIRGKRVVAFLFTSQTVPALLDRFDRSVLIRDTNSYRVYSDRSIIGSQMHEHDTICPSVLQGHFEYPSQRVAADWNHSRVRCLLIKSGRSMVLHKVLYLWNNWRSAIITAVDGKTFSSYRIYDLKE